MPSNKRSKRRRRLTDRLFYLFSSGHETEIDKSGNPNTSDRVPFELVDELEWEGEKVDPDGAVTRTLSAKVIFHAMKARRTVECGPRNG
jgi:hypothetical protein